MRLAAGARLGPYEILAPLGAGGMGEVYKARDTRLGRDVAVKILLHETSSSPEALQRFEREARTISQLSHPHICALYDVGEAPNPQSPIPNPYLVMELLEGETLAQRLAGGALPLDATLRYAVQIADALDKAHGAGIVHRDLKPANVMLTKSGVKLLDFGLAKAVTPSALSFAATTPPVPPITAHGVMAGTVQYMAPEQLAGRPADARSDIYAFGAVVYEMATGRAAFGSSIAPIVPAVLGRLVRTCMAADPGERWQSAHDVWLQLRAIAETTSGADAVAPAPATTRQSRLPWVIAAIGVTAAAAALLAVIVQAPRAGVPAAASGAVRFVIPPPEGGVFVDTVEELCIALSPDGSQLAYLAAIEGGPSRVWIRPMAAVEARPLAGTDGARSVFWSPDGRSLGFFAGTALKRLDLPDGAPVTLSEVSDVRSVGTWGDGQILFGKNPAGIFRVSASGGAPVLVIAPDRSKKEIGILWPWFLPDGKRFLYTARRADGTGTIMVGEAGAPSRELVATSSNAQYVDPGYIVYGRDGTLMAQRFDLTRTAVTGEPFPIAEPVRFFLSTGVTTFTTSRTGVLVHQSHAEQGRLVWFDRAGAEVGTIGARAGYSRVRISPDGRRVLFDRAQPGIGTYDIWTFDTDRKVEQRITSDRLSEISGVWLPDGNIVFSGGVPPHLFRKTLSTLAEEQMLPPSAPVFDLTEDLSPDGRTFVFTRRTPRGNFDIWTMALNGSPAASPIAETPFDEASVRFSPDGRFLAYASDELGRYEVFVAPFPVTGAKTRVSTAGGALPRWSADGRELFYVTGDLHLAAVPIRTAPVLAVGAPHALFAIHGGTLWSDAKPNAGWPSFDVSMDGKRFIAVVPEPGNAQSLNVVMNWPQAVQRK